MPPKNQCYSTAFVTLRQIDNPTHHTVYHSITTQVADLFFSRAVLSSGLSCTSAIVHSQLAAIQLLSDKSFLSSNGTLDITEISVCESSWLSGSSVDGNTDINDIVNITEELVEIGIGHLEGDVTDEEGLGWLGWPSGLVGFEHIVHNDAAALKDRLVLGLDGGSGLLDSLEENVAETRYLLALCCSILLRNIPFAQAPIIGGDK